MYKFKKYLLKIFIYITSFFFLGYLFLIIYINLNKADILKNVTEKIENEINGNVSIGDVSLSFFRNFPKISVLLNEVKITDLQFKNHHYPFFKGEDVFVQVDAWKLLQNQFAVKGIKIEHAQFYVFTDSTGYTNGYLFKLKEAGSTSALSFSDNNLHLKKVILKNVGLTINDAEKKKFYDLFVNRLAVNINNNDSALLLAVNAGLVINKLIFSEGGRGILKDQKVDGNFNLRYNKQLQELHTDSMDLKIGGQPFNLNFTIDMKSPAPKFELKVNKGSILFADMKSFLNRNSKPKSDLLIER